jgi:hypothetical protein
MTNEEKVELLFTAANKSWNNAFEGWECSEIKGKSKRFLLGENKPQYGFAFFIGANEDMYNGIIWIEYAPEKDMVELYIKGRPIQEKFKEDFKALFEKYSPFGMTVSYSRNNPVFAKKAKVEPADIPAFFNDFKNAYKDYYPLFYMFTGGEKELYEGFYIMGEDC